MQSQGTGGTLYEEESGLGHFPLYDISRLRVNCAFVGCNKNNPITIHTSSELCKNASLVVYLVQTVIHIQSVHSQVCVYITLWEQWLPRAIVGTRVIGSSALPF
jgi:hypothetical protein